MDTLKDFEFKGRKYIPVFPKASGKPTDHIDGYPYEDDKPMSATIPHSVQLQTFFGQLLRYFAINEYVLVGADNFIYYREGDPTKCVAPDVFVVLGVALRKLPRVEVSIRGQKVLFLPPFLNFSPNPQPLTTGMKKCACI